MIVILDIPMINLMLLLLQLFNIYLYLLVVFFTHWHLYDPLCVNTIVFNCSFCTVSLRLRSHKRQMTQLYGNNSIKLIEKVRASVRKHKIVWTLFEDSSLIIRSIAFIRSLLWAFLIVCQLIEMIKKRSISDWKAIEV